MVHVLFKISNSITLCLDHSEVITAPYFVIILIITLNLDYFQVITAQYFVWFFCLFPLILPWSKVKLRSGLICLALWAGSQVHWLMWGYLLEFKGQNVFLQLWLSSILFLAANVFILVVLITNHHYSPLFLRSAKMRPTVHDKNK